MSSEMISYYRIIRKLGAGGMGEVYLGEDIRLDRKVALKILPEQFTRSEDRVRRFIQEAKSASALNHPNIITIYDIGQVESSHFIATEYIEGETLRRHIGRGRMNVSEALDIAIQIASALGAAHQAGIIHRDIKPENVMIRPDGYVKVLDFGLAKLIERRGIDSGTGAATIPINTEPGTVLGTVKYMSPEQVRGLALDDRSDIFSFGVLFYEMLSGHVPFEGSSTADTLISILQNQPPPLASYTSGASVEIEQIINKCLEKDRERRYGSSQELLSDLKGLVSGRSKEQLIARPSPSIAVLPFVNMSADPENEYFCDGLAEELLNALAKIEELRVAARTSSFSFKGKGVDIREVGGKLGVNTVLEGSVRKAGNRLRITAQLVNVADGFHLWSERYDRQMEDIFEIQDEITLAIIDALKVKLLGEQKPNLIKRYTDNTQAYQLYLKGRYYYNKWTEDGFKKAVEHYQQAINTEPDYALAHAEIANCLGTLLYFGYLAPNETLPAIMAAIEKALRIDDSLAEAHLTLAKIKFYYEWDFAGAERGFRQALELNPNYSEAHLFYAFYLVAMNQDDKALIEGARAQELDPISLICNLLLGFIYLLAGRPDLVVEQSKKLLEMEPNFYGTYWLLGASRIFDGKYDEAIEAYQKTLNLGGGHSAMGMLGYIYGVTGKPDRALEIIKELSEMKERQYVPSYNIALACAGLGQRDAALDWLDKAFEERNGPLATLNRDTLLKELHSDSRFQNLLSLIGLPR
jgi:eukaryotic-like serine/threonine-protein kinase